MMDSAKSGGGLEGDFGAARGRPGKPAGPGVKLADVYGLSKKQLEGICRKNRLSAVGTREELAERVTGFLRGGLGRRVTRYTICPVCHAQARATSTRAKIVWYKCCGRNKHCFKLPR